MNLDLARELRQELEAIEAAMQRIKILAEELPTADELENLADVVRDISSPLDNIVQQAERLPSPKELRPLLVKVPDPTGRHDNPPASAY
jgi:hypothetical protein